MFQLRPYEPGDYEVVVGMFLANTPTYFHPKEQEDLETYLKTELEHYFVATTANEVVACGGCNIKEGIGWLSWYIVHPHWHGKGAGSALVQHNLAILRNDARVAKLAVRTSQLVFPFYEKFGYRLVFTKENYWGEGFHLYHMEMEPANQQLEL